MQLLPMLTFLIHLTISCRHDASYALTLHCVFLKYKELFYITTAQPSKSGKSNPRNPLKLASSIHILYKSGSNPGTCVRFRDHGSLVSFHLKQLLGCSSYSLTFLKSKSELLCWSRFTWYFFKIYAFFGKNADTFHCMRKHEVLIGPIIRNINFYHFIKMESATFLYYKVNYYICCTI